MRLVIVKMRAQDCALCVDLLNVNTLILHFGMSPHANLETWLSDDSGVRQKVDNDEN
jgi:hypothetical protein